MWNIIEMMGLPGRLNMLIMIDALNTLHVSKRVWLGRVRLDVFAELKWAWMGTSCGSTQNTHDISRESIGNKVGIIWEMFWFEMGTLWESSGT